MLIQAMIFGMSPMLSIQRRWIKLRNAILTKHQRGYGRLCKKPYRYIQKRAVPYLGIFILKVDG